MPQNKTIHHYGTNSVQVMQSVPVQTPNNTTVWGLREQLKWPPRMHRNKSDNRIPHLNQVEGVTHKNLKSSHKGPWGKIKEKSRILKNVQWSLVMGSPGGGKREKREKIWHITEGPSSQTNAVSVWSQCSTEIMFTDLDYLGSAGHQDLHKHSTVRSNPRHQILHTVRSNTTHQTLQTVRSSCTHNTLQRVKSTWSSFYTAKFYSKHDIPHRD